MAGKITFKDTGGEVPGQQESKRSEKKRGKKEESAPSLFSSKRDAQDMGPDYGSSRIRIHKNDEVNIYADEADARHAMDPRGRALIVLAVILVATFAVSAIVPPNCVYNMMVMGQSAAETLAQFSTQTLGFIGFFQDPNTQYGSYVWEIVASIAAGLALGLSGGVYQGALKNALASPSTLGVTSGGTLGIVIYAVFFYKGEFVGSVSEYNEWLASLSTFDQFMELYGQALCALVGCFTIVAVIMLIATVAGHGKVSNVSLVIAGQVFTSVIGVVITWVKYYLVQTADSDTVQLLNNAQSASFTGLYTWQTILMFAVPLAICIAVVLMMSRRLSLLAFSDEEARSMGISTNATRNLMVALCTIMTALVIAFCGPIGFVGFMVPHIARKIVGPGFAYLLPACALLGGVLVGLVHTVSMLGIPGIAIGSTGTFTSILGCILFVVVALRQRRGSNVDWL